MTRTVSLITANIIIYVALIKSSHNPTKTLIRNKLFQIPKKPLALSANCTTEPKIYGFRLETSPKNQQTITSLGVPDLLTKEEHEIRLFGEHFNKDMLIAFTAENLTYGADCEFLVTRGFPIIAESYTPESVKVKVEVPPLDQEDAFFICVKADENQGHFRHQGTEYFLAIVSHTEVLSFWATILIIIVCLSCSFLLSGLNIGLLSMDQTELKIISNAGNSKERRYAAAIFQVRQHGNYLLCSILLGNVFVNSIFTVLLDEMTSGTIAVIISTISLAILGEVMPQVLCARFGLLIGAKTIYITKAVMVLTFPLSYPLAKILNFILGEEIGHIYDRERLKELITTTPVTDLDKQEFQIISGALELNKKTVKDVMTPIEDVYMLDYNSVLDFETVSQIMNSGYSRIPIYQNNRQNIVSVLYIKDLAFLDPDDKTELKILCEFYKNSCTFVFEDVTLDVMFKLFKEGQKGHMAFIHRLHAVGDIEPFYQIIGLVTLEDVIEELIQDEIMDESDVVTDNRTRRLRISQKRLDFSVFLLDKQFNQDSAVSPQLTLAAYQFLSTSLKQFQPPLISETILMRLLKRDIFFHLKKNRNWRNDPVNLIYECGVSADYFVLILEGRVEVTIGRENLVFETGSFTYFGTQALPSNPEALHRDSTVSEFMDRSSSSSSNFDGRFGFLPDYTVKACTDVVYLKVRGGLYVAAVKASSLMQQTTEEDVEKLDDEAYDRPSSSNKQL